MFSHEGPRRGDVFAMSAFAKQIAKIEYNLQNSIIKVGNLDSIRTFADVRDTVKAYWLLVNKCFFGDVCNIGGNETITIGEMLDRLIKISTRRDLRVEVDPSLLRPSDVTLQIPCVDKFKKLTGWEPKISLDTTLQDTLDYWRDYWSKNE
jgi:GDP-D-mannose dehydratase